MKKGRAPAFFRLGDGEYELIAYRRHKANLSNEFELLGDDEGEGESLVEKEQVEVYTPFENIPRIEAGLEKLLDPIEIIVQTLAQRPYQAYFKKQKCWYPESEAVGWEARLDAYFWPTRKQTWSLNKIKFTAFCNRFGVLDKNWDVGTDTTKTGLLSLFRDVCIWGNVKLPEENPDILVNEVNEALRYIDAGQIPQNCRMNSAWTKLYAVARPDSFIIYDSRVATAIVSLLDPYMQRLDGAPAFEPYRELGYVNGRGGTRPRTLRWEWKNGYQRWEAQYAANQLCNAIVERLNEAYPKKAQGNAWSLREVESVLFMEGY